MKMSGPASSGLRAILYNVVGLLIVSLILVGQGKGGGGLGYRVIEGVMMVLMFPISLTFSFSLPGGLHLILVVINPVCWGVVAYAIHKGIITRKCKA